MNNEIKAWIETTDDVVALKVLAHAITERLNDLHEHTGGGGGDGPANLAAPTAMTGAPTRRTEPSHSGKQAKPMTGPSPSPFFLDALKADANQAVMADIRDRTREASAVQRQRAEDLNKEAAEGGEGAEAPETEGGHESEKPEEHPADGSAGDPGAPAAHAPKPKAPAKRRA